MTLFLIKISNHNVKWFELAVPQAVTAIKYGIITPEGAILHNAYLHNTIQNAFNRYSLYEILM